MSEPETATLHYQHHTIPLLIHRSAKRRSVGITIDHNGVRVAAPLRMSRKRVMELVTTKAGWIVEKHLEFQSKLAPAKRFVSGERFMYLGREVVLSVNGESGQPPPSEGRRPSAPANRRPALQADLFSFDFSEVLQTARGGGRPKPWARLTGELLEVFPGNRPVREVLEGWYRAEAERVIAERVAFYAGQLEWPMPRVLIRDQKKRWGSCNAKGELRFNWRLVQAEIGILDYVVVHEMAHLKVLNHSSKYWYLVARIMPTYRVYHDALNEVGAGLYW
ncbi:MAG: SprT family zinc-dependent metalloprotease [Meiothermus sp.]|nr:SprT family zinc-dependent metalloprotease [Meiothermus sp.]